MSDTLGRITVPSIAPSGTFPLVTKWPYGIAQKRPVVVHQFGSANSKIEQRFYVGTPARRFTFSDPALNSIKRAALRDFWESTKGGYGAFTYAVPQEDGTTVSTTVCFENQPISFQDFISVCSAGVTFVELPNPANAPTYSINSTVTRFPDSTLATNLLQQTQELIPLVRVRVLDTNVPDIFLSDRRVTVGSQLYLPRLLHVGDPGSDALMSQSIDGSSDDVTLAFGNADRVMVQLANDTQLRWGRVELSFLRVDTTSSGTVLQLWAGKIIDWSSDAGPEFSIQCSDVLSALTLSSPRGRGSRTCANRYGQDGCPAVPGSQAMDLVHFPSSSNASCDLGYNTPNGCMAHQVTQSYRATYGAPQSVLIKDNSTGVMGFGRNLLNATSIVSDTFYGKTIPEIWHNDDGVVQYGLPVPCKIVAGRDESDFYIALGMIGHGPLGGLTAPQMWDSNADGKPDTFIGSTLDGQPNHGVQLDSNGHQIAGKDASLGLRFALGADPAGAHDYFSLGRVATTGLGWFTQAGDGSQMFEEAYLGSAYNKIFAAGVALLEIRRTDTPGVQPSSPDGHTMVATVSKGLSGYIWTAPGSRSSTAGCTNPFWVAINTFLRSVTADTFTASTQETYFDVSAAIAAAAVADTSVPKIFGIGNELQFRFKGTVDDLRPVRDWLSFILTSGLGYYTWSFGKLRVGCRYNASVVSAFTAGNMLFNSLRLTPVKATFEKLVVSFRDQEYLYAANTVEYVDQSFAARNGRSQNPLTADVSVTGCVTKSAAGRIGAIRTREELGGVTQAEQDAARVAVFRSTIIALDTEAGAVISIADPDVPAGAGKFRVQRWTLYRDWSVEIEAKSVTDSMYDLTVGPKPADVQPAPIPTEAARDSNVPPAPGFDVKQDDIDATAVRIYDISFADSVNTHSINAGTFTLAYVDENAASYRLNSSISSGSSTITLSSIPATIHAGDYGQIDGEIILFGAPGGTSVPITRGQLGTTAASHLALSVVAVVQERVLNVPFPVGFFDGPDASSWRLSLPLPAAKIAVVIGYVTNAYGNSDPTVFSLTGLPGNGLVLASPGENSNGIAVTNILNSDTALDVGTQIVNVVATTRDVTITLPSETASFSTQVQVNPATNNTFNVKVLPLSPDTIAGASAARALAAGQSEAYGAITASGDWTVVAATLNASAPPAAPNLDASWLSGVGAYFTPDGNRSKYGFQGTITPQAVANLPHLKQIFVTEISPSGDRNTTPVFGPFTAGTAISFKTDPGNILDPTFTTTPLVWTLEFAVENDASSITPTPFLRSITVTPASVATITVSETGPRVADAQRGLTTTATVSITSLLNNPGTQPCTVWETHDWGDPQGGSTGQRTTWKGWYPITGNSGPIVLGPPNNNLWVTTISPSTIVTIRVAAGTFDSNAPIPTWAATATFTMTGPDAGTVGGNWISSANFTGLTGKLKYFSVGGGAYSWQFGTIAATVAFSTHPSLKSTRWFVQAGKLTGGVWTPDPDPVSGAERPFCDAQVAGTDSNTSITKSGDAMTIALVVSWPMPPSNYAYPHARIRAAIISTSEVITTQAAFAGQAPPCSEIAFSADGQYAYLEPDMLKALATATPWDPSVLGNRLAPDGTGKLAYVTPVANNVTAATATVQTASLGGLPVWNVTGSITLPAVYSGVQRVHVRIESIGLELLTIQASTFVVDGSNRIFYTTTNQLQDSAIHNYTVSYSVENADGAIAASPFTTGITVPAGTIPFSGNAPSAPDIVTATANYTLVPSGNSDNVLFSGTFTVPGGNTSHLLLVRITRVGPGADTQEADITTLSAPTGGWTAGQVIAWKGPADLQLNPAADETWRVKLTGYNDDLKANNPLLLGALTVARPAIQAGTLSATETPGSRYQSADGQRGLLTSINVSGVLNVNPGGQLVTIWLNNGDGRGDVCMGVLPVTGTSFTIKIGPATGSIVWMSTALNQNWIVKAAAGYWPASPIPASAFSASFNVHGPGYDINGNSVISLTGTCINAAIATFSYRKTPGNVYFWLWSGITFAKNTPALNPDLWFVQTTLQLGTGVGGSWARLPGHDGDEINIGTDMDGIITVGGSVVTMPNSPPQPMPPNDQQYTYRFRMYAFTRRDADPGTLLTAWFGAAYLDFQPDITKAVLTATALDPSVAGRGSYVTSGGKLASNVGISIANNWDFEDGTLGGMPDAWTTDGFQNGTIQLVSSPVYAGTKSCRLTGTRSAPSQYIPCRPGQEFYLEAYINSDSGTNGSFRVVLVFLNSASTFLGSAEAPVTNPTGGVWANPSVNGVAPAGSSQVQLFLSTQNNSTGAWYIDNVILRNVITGRQVKRGPGLMDDGSGNLKVAAGNGFSFDGGNNIVLNANAEFKFVGGQLQMNAVDFSKGFNGFAVDGSAIPKITISPLGVALGWIGYDSVSGYSGAWFKRVVIGGTSPANAPFVADANGNVSINGSLIVGQVANAVTAVTAGNANFATNANVAAVFNGQIFATQVNAGTFNGLALTLNLNGVTTTIANIFDSGPSSNVGLKVVDNSNPNNYTYVSASQHGCIVNGSGGTRRVYLGYLPDPGSGFYGAILLLEGNHRKFRWDDTGVYLNGSVTPSGTQNVAFVKPGGATGTMFFIDGFFQAAV